MSIARKYLLLTALIGAVLILGLFALLMVSYHHTEVLEDKLKELEARVTHQEQARVQAIQMAGPGVATSPVDQQIKDLSTRFVGDTRTISEKLRDFIAERSDAQRLGIACKVVAELAENRDALGDQELAWLYGTQADTTFKRVIAQVLSLRGDNHVMDSYIAGLQTGLANPGLAERRKVLAELGKTRYAGAAKLLLPSLQDDDISILLDALLALRVTGNEGQLQMLDKLQKHPDESVRWLAGDVANNLQMLSKKARTRLIMPDIVAELPPIGAQ